MESIKPILLMMVLVGVGYAVYVALNRVPAPEPPPGVAPAWNKSLVDQPGRPARHDHGRDREMARSSGPRSSANLSADSPATTAALAAPSAPLPALLGARQETTVPGGSAGSSLPFGIGSRSLPSQAPAAAAPTVAQASPVVSQPNSVAPGNQQSPDRQPDELSLAKHQFAASKRAAQTMLSQGKLVEALRELSPWYDHPAVAPDEQAQLIELLGELAGTVIYSREHWLAAPHVMREGETLMTIAQQCAVPWQLLAKINGIDNPNAVSPGEELKIIRGPFNAQLSRQQNWLALFVDGMYSGRFHISGSAELGKPDGLYPVTKFAADHPTNYARRPYISLGGDLHILVDDAVGSAPGQGATAVRISQRDMDDVFDILSERSQITIRR